MFIVFILEYIPKYGYPESLILNSILSIFPPSSLSLKIPNYYIRFKVVDYRFLVFIIFFGTIILPSIVIAYCYISIYKRIRSEERQIKCLLRASERQRRISVRRKLIRILLILVLTYAFCWYPLYLINTVDLFLPPTYHPGQMTTLFAVVLSHLNCALNPLIYAYGVKNQKFLAKFNKLFKSDARLQAFLTPFLASQSQKYMYPTASKYQQH